MRLPGPALFFHLEAWETSRHKTDFCLQQRGPGSQQDSESTTQNVRQHYVLWVRGWKDREVGGSGSRRQLGLEEGDVSGEGVRHTLQRAARAEAGERTGVGGLGAGKGDKLVCWSSFSLSAETCVFHLHFGK